MEEQPEKIIRFSNYIPGIDMKGSTYTIGARLLLAREPSYIGASPSVLNYNQVIGDTKYRTFLKIQVTAPTHLRELHVGPVKVDFSRYRKHLTSDCYYRLVPHVFVQEVRDDGKPYREFRSFINDGGILLGKIVPDKYFDVCFVVRIPDFGSACVDRSSVMLL